MEDLRDDRDVADHAGVEAHRGSTTGAPRWVKGFGIIALLMVLLIAILLLVGGHGPGRHLRSGDAQAPLVSVTASARGHTSG